MIFNSSSFLFLFLPVVLGGYVVLEHWAPLFWRQSWLLAGSLVFYGWANVAAFGLLLPLVGFNYVIARALVPRRKRLLWIGVGVNVGVLCYFKYANFFVGNLNAVLQTHVFLENILLPLGISFLTFMQIAWLVAAWRQEAVPCSLFEFFLYSTFFPQVVAGPIVYQNEAMPQFRRARTPDERAVDFCVGGTLFTMGLAKKVLVADTLAPWASQVFWAASTGHALSMASAWIGGLAYTFQLYFDFSGYSDMAIGTARLFGIRLPLNFNSPYKAESITEFWRRWHMTLSRFLRDYVYIPIGGNRCGSMRRSFNLFATMVIGGFWHGAGWTFLLWGALHGAFLVINHRWASWLERCPGVPHLFEGWSGRILTFLSVLVAWIFFRAEHPAQAWKVLVAMTGADGLVISADKVFAKSSPLLLAAFEAVGISIEPQAMMVGILALLGLFVWGLPNSQQLLAAHEPGLITYGKSIEGVPWKWMVWKPNAVWFVATTLVFLWCMLNISNVSSFLYRDF